ncbi:hypothetical protein LCGC14_2639930, partial [marine sediment metagenome]
MAEISFDDLIPAGNLPKEEDKPEVDTLFDDLIPRETGPFDDLIPGRSKVRTRGSLIRRPPPDVEPFTPVANTASAAIESVKHLFTGPFGFTRDELGPLVAQNSKETEGVMGTVRAFNEVLVGGTAVGADIIMRTGIAPIVGGIAAAGQALTEITGNRTDGKRLVRDLNMLLLSVMAVSGTGGGGRFVPKGKLAQRPGALGTEAGGPSLTRMEASVRQRIAAVEGEFDLRPGMLEKEFTSNAQIAGELVPGRAPVKLVAGEKIGIKSDAALAEEAIDILKVEQNAMPGNLNLARINTSEDVKAILLEIEAGMQGFPLSRRGVISRTETMKLAENLGMTIEELLARRQGIAFNAEEATAANVLLLSSGENLMALARLTDESSEVSMAIWRKAVLRQALIMEQVSGIKAESGRALAAQAIGLTETATGRGILGIDSK